MLDNHKNNGEYIDALVVALISNLIHEPIDLH